MSFLAKVTLLFSGGCELLFEGENSIVVEGTIPEGTTVSQLVQIIRTQYIKERPELFVDASGANIRPGILVLVNACDVEVLGGMSYVIEDGDEVEFISTLHGG